MPHTCHRRCPSTLFLSSGVFHVEIMSKPGTNGAFQTYCHKSDAEGWYFFNARRTTTRRKQLQTSGDGPIFRLPGCHEKDQQKHEVILIWGWALYSFNTKDPAQKSHPSHLKLSQILWAPSGTLNIWLRSFTPSNKQKQRTNSVLPNYPRHDT